MLLLFFIYFIGTVQPVVQSTRPPDKDGLRSLKSGRRHFTWGCADTLLIKASPHISAPEAREAQWIITCWEGACINVGLKVRGGIIFQGVDRKRKFCCKRVKKKTSIFREKETPNVQSWREKVKKMKSWKKEQMKPWLFLICHLYIEVQ